MPQILAEFASDLTKTIGQTAILQAMLHRVAAVVRDDCTPDAAFLMMPAYENLQLISASPQAAQPNDADLQAADRAWRFAARQETTAPGWAGSRFVFHPLVQAGTVIAVIGHRALSDTLQDLHFREQTVQAIFHQGLMALDRTSLAAKAETARYLTTRGAKRSAFGNRGRNRPDGTPC